MIYLHIFELVFCMYKSVMFNFLDKNHGRSYIQILLKSIFMYKPLKVLYTNLQMSNIQAAESVLSICKSRQTLYTNLWMYIFYAQIF